MRVFAGVPWRGGQTTVGNRKSGLTGFPTYVFGTLGNEANIIM